MGTLAIGQNKLTELEQEALVKWREHKNKPPLSPVLSLQMFELFLAGATCEEIVKVNKNMFTLGQVLEARIAHGWDERRERYLAELYGGVLDKVKQTQVEAVSFTADLLSAAHKMYGTKLKKYIQSGDEKDLEESGIQLTSLQGYTKAVETLMKLTGQDKKDKGAPSMVVVAGGMGPDARSEQVVEMNGVGGTERLDSSLAFKVLKMLEESEEPK